MGAIRYFGRHRNAGYGYPLHLRLRRGVAFWLAERGDWPGSSLVRLGWLIDFDRDRYLEDGDEL